MLRNLGTLVCKFKILVGFAFSVDFEVAIFEQKLKYIYVYVFFFQILEFYAKNDFSAKSRLFPKKHLNFHCKIFKKFNSKMDDFHAKNIPSSNIR